jgi:phytoene synthase
MKEDLTITRFPTFSDLVHYMEGSALTVGQAMTYILGTHPPHKIEDALPGADSLSTAMQLSNFWRDIGQDWDIGRVYLPQEDLQRFKVTEDDLADRRITPQFIDLLEFQIERTETYYLKARGSIKMLASGQWGVMSSLEIYHAILIGIRRNHYDVFHRRAGAGGLRKAGLVLKSYFQVRQG